MMQGAQLQTLARAEAREMARLSLEMASKKRPTWDPDVIRARMKDARRRKRLEVKEAAELAGMTIWNWYKKEGSGPDAFQPDQCIRFAEAIGAPSMFPFYDWDHAEELDERLGWK